MNEADIPRSFFCPITSSVMRDPVIDPDGNSYERSAIEEWLARNATSPVTRQPLMIGQLNPNRALRDAINEMEEKFIREGHSDPFANIKKMDTSLPSSSSSVSEVPFNIVISEADLREFYSEAAPENLDNVSSYLEHYRGKHKELSDALFLKYGRRPKHTELTDSDASDTLEIVMAPDTALIAGQAQSVHVMTSIATPAGSERTASDICCVVDVSGSMGAEATMKTTEGDTSGNGLSLLDIVKHAIKTIIKTLTPKDRLSVVTYSSRAQTVFELTAMDAEGKAMAVKKLDEMHPGGQTNLWDGLHMGLELLRQSASGRLAAVLILTDGMPNIAPPRGHIPMLREYKDKHSNLNCTINSFGFGYNLDSKLLSNLAVEGDGMYAFIPDSSFVGTAFVNATANLLVTMAKNVMLSLEPLNGAELDTAGGSDESSLLGGGQCQVASWGMQVALGSLQYGQSKDVVVRLKLPASWTPGTKYLSATLSYVDKHGGVAAQSKSVEQMCAAPEPSPEAQVQVLRLRFVDTVRQALAEMQQRDSASAVALVESLVAEAKSSAICAVGESSSIGARALALLADLEGQVTEALSRDDWFQRWGGHYLLSLMRAHQLQQCNNFKDPGIQHYGGKLFLALRDEADAIFSSLPPPTPSIASFSSSSSYARTRGGGGGASRTAHAPVNMAVYNNAGNPCFHGNCTVRMACGGLKPVREVRMGDAVSTGARGGSATVRCVVKTLCAGGVTPLVRLAASQQKRGAGQQEEMEEEQQMLLVTPWHPIRSGVCEGEGGGEWVFPSSLAPACSHACDAVYSFVLESDESDEGYSCSSSRENQHMVIGGWEAVALGHGYTKGAVVTHPYFGSKQVVEDLRATDPAGFDAGLVQFRPDCMMRAASTGLLCGFQSSHVIGGVEQEQQQQRVQA